MNNLFRQIVFFNAAMILIASLAANYYLTGIYVHYPRTPDSAAERVVPYRLKGITVYFTSTDKRKIDFVMLFQLGAGLVSFAMIAADRIKASRRLGVRP
jgi:hypothetical protein